VEGGGWKGGRVNAVQKYRLSEGWRQNFEQLYSHPLLLLFSLMPSLEFINPLIQALPGSVTLLLQP
jgi:hypothetical protein